MQSRPRIPVKTPRGEIDRGRRLRPRFPCRLSTHRTKFRQRPNRTNQYRGDHSELTCNPWQARVAGSDELEAPNHTQDDSSNVRILGAVARHPQSHMQAARRQGIYSNKSAAGGYWRREPWM